MWQDREFFKRLQTVFQNRKVNPRAVWAHMTNHVLLPILSFCDDTLQGEDRMLYPGAADHMDSWPQTDLVTSCYSPAFGWRCHFLGNWTNIPKGQPWTKDDPDGTKLTRSIIASLWPLGLRQSWQGEAKTKWKASVDIYNFTGNKADFPMTHPYTPSQPVLLQNDPVPYWRTAEIIKVSDPDIKATLWKRPDRILMMLSNFGKSEREVSVAVNMNQLWLTEKPVGQDFYFRENIVVDQEDPGEKIISKFDREKTELSISVKVNPHDFRMLQIIK